MSNVDPKIASHAGMWLKSAELIEKNLARLTSDELEAYRYIRNIFTEPEPDMERLQVAQETLREVGQELRDDYGAAVKNFAAKVSVIVKDFHAFREAVKEKHRSEPVVFQQVVFEKKESTVTSDKLSKPMPDGESQPKNDKPKKIKIPGKPYKYFSSSHEEPRYYYGFIDEEGRAHGEGEFYDGEKKIYGIFSHGMFPNTGTVIYSSKHRTFTGDFKQKYSTYSVKEELETGKPIDLSYSGIVRADDGTIFESREYDRNLFPNGNECTIKHPDGSILYGKVVAESLYEGTRTYPDGREELAYYKSNFFGYKYCSMSLSAAKIFSKASMSLSLLMAAVCLYTAISGTLNWGILGLNAFISLIPLSYDKDLLIFTPNKFNSIFLSSIITAIFSIWISLTDSWWNLLCLLPAIAPIALLVYVWVKKYD